MLTYAVPTINRIYRGLKAAGDAAAIASDDLTQPLPRAGKDEVGALIMQIAGMRDSLLTLIEAVRHNVEPVAQASIKLKNSANSSSQMSENLFSAASSMATSMEKLSASKFDLLKLFPYHSFMTTKQRFRNKYRLEMALHSHLTNSSKDDE